MSNIENDTVSVSDKNIPSVLDKAVQVGKAAGRIGAAGLAAGGSTYALVSQINAAAESQQPQAANVYNLKKADTPTPLPSAPPTPDQMNALFQPTLQVINSPTVEVRNHKGTPDPCLEDGTGCGFIDLVPTVSGLGDEKGKGKSTCIVNFTGAIHGNVDLCTPEPSLTPSNTPETPEETPEETKIIETPEETDTPTPSPSPTITLPAPPTVVLTTPQPTRVSTQVRASEGRSTPQAKIAAGSSSFYISRKGVKSGPAGASVLVGLAFGVNQARKEFKRNRNELRGNKSSKPSRR